jgi:hypothetical protein
MTGFAFSKCKNIVELETKNQSKGHKFARKFLEKTGLQDAKFERSPRHRSASKDQMTDARSLHPKGRNARGGPVGNRFWQGKVGAMNVENIAPKPGSHGLRARTVGIE